MKDGGNSRVRFLDLPVRSRNRATDLFARIKGELRKKYPLKDLRLKWEVSGWDDLSLRIFMMLPKEHYLRIIDGKAKTSGQDLVKQINGLYAIFDGKGKNRPEK